MAKFKPMVSLNMKVTQSDVVGILDMDEDGELSVFVDDEVYTFDSIKDLFVGGTIEMHSIVPIEE